jgi:hypothetical protein
VPTNFPTALDSFSDPSPGSPRNSPSLSGEISNANDTLLAIERVLLGPVFYNVKGYGAKGDGSTDDTAAIQAAITAAESAGSGVVFLPPGGYKISSTLVISDKAVSIIGAQSLGIWNGVVIAPTDMSFDAIEVNAVNFACILANFQIKTLSQTSSGGRGIFLNNVQNCKMRDLVIAGLWDGIYVTGGEVVGENIDITPADVAGTGRYGVWVSGLSGNANSCNLRHVGVSQIGSTNVNTVDGFVLADGYNSLELDSCGALSCWRGLWSTKTTGTAPQFLTGDMFSADHCEIGIQLDHGGMVSLDQPQVISSIANSIVVAATYEGGPVQLNSPYLADTNGGIQILGGTEVNISCANLDSIGTGPSDNLPAIELSGAADVVITGIVASMYTGTNLNGTVQLDAAFSGSLVMTGFNLPNNYIGIWVKTGCTGTYRISDGVVSGSYSANATFAAAHAGSRVSNVQGVNPFGHQTPPSVPATTVQLTNPFPFDCNVFVTGGTVTVIAIGGTATGLTSGSFRVPAGQTITLTYSSAPTWVWLGD